MDFSIIVISFSCGMVLSAGTLITYIQCMRYRNLQIARQAENDARAKPVESFNVAQEWAVRVL